jgi:hypothetical protein
MMTTTTTPNSATAPALVPRRRRLGEITIYEEGAGDLHLLLPYANGRHAYAHSFASAAHAAEVVHAILTGLEDDPASWEGDQPDLWADAEEWPLPDADLYRISEAMMRGIAAGLLTKMGGGTAAQEFADELRRLSTCSN